jgi:hypothetical protein
MLVKKYQRSSDSKLTGSALSVAGEACCACPMLHTAFERTFTLTFFGATFE